MVHQAIVAKQRALSVGQMRARMPHSVIIVREPTARDPSRSLHDSIFGANPDLKDILKCTLSRSVVPDLQGGMEPSDQAIDRWDAIVPGGVPVRVKVGDVAVAVGEERIEGVVYKIKNIQEDWQRYIARMQMESYS